jgi:ribosomal protein S18 acetylase RimI-like enzyme
VEVGGEHAGSLALTDEGNGVAAIRWFVLSPEVRGRGLGRRLLGEMLARATELGYTRVRLETFSELEAAAHLYCDHGFELVSMETAPRWGRERITYQRYELELSTATASLSA